MDGHRGLGRLEPTTYFEASGACRTDKDRAVVVDSQRRVNGVRSRRMADTIKLCIPRLSAAVLIGLRMAEILTAPRARRERERSFVTLQEILR
jgi:hypothetical protein